MTKTLTAHGNSAALIIDKPIMELLHITMETPLEISTDGKKLIISPITDDARQKAFKAATDDVFKKHGKLLKRLAK